jgi:hypothetical protein
MSMTTYLGNKLLDHCVGKTSFTMPTVWVALFKTQPTIAGGGTECAYTGYARDATAGADWAAASSLANSNAAEFNFGTKTAGTDETVGWWATFDASTSGNMLEFGSLTASKLIANGDTPKIPIGDLDRTAS